VKRKKITRNGEERAERFMPKVKGEDMQKLLGGE